jgi:hypothetical protein
MTQDRDKWRALWNMVLKFGFSQMWGNSSIAEELLASQWLCSMDLVLE